MCKVVTLLYSRDRHSIVSQLYFNNFFLKNNLKMLDLRKQSYF